MVQMSLVACHHYSRLKRHKDEGTNPSKQEDAEVPLFEV